MGATMHSAINLDEGRVRRARRAYQPVERSDAEKESRERRKRLWLDRIDADLPSTEGRSDARKFHVSLRLIRQISGLIVNLDSFLDRGYVYASQATLAGYIKNANEQRMSDRQVRRGVAFLEARGHLRVARTRGTHNQMYPLYRALTAPDSATTTDTMSADTGLHVLPFGGPCPPKQASKLLDQPKKEPPLPPVAPVTPMASGGNSDQPIVTRKDVPASSTERPERPEAKESGLSTKQDQIRAELQALKAEVARELDARVPFNDLYALIGRGNRGAATGNYLKLTPKQTHNAKRTLLQQHENGPLPHDFPVAAVFFGMVGLDQCVVLATEAGPVGVAAPHTKYVQLKPYSDEWKQERERRVAEGEDVRLMDNWADRDVPKNWEVDAAIYEARKNTQCR
jgi:hypothetical protein